MTNPHFKTRRGSKRTAWLALAYSLAASSCSGSISIAGSELQPATTPAPSTGAAAAAPVTNTAAPISAAPASAPPPPINAAPAPPTSPGAVAGDDRCQPESESALCARLGKECGALAAADNCGASRTISSCGQCPPPQSCGADGEPNRCALAQSGPVEEYTLVVVRHGRTRANECSDACGGVACCRAFPCAEGCSDCYCAAWQNDLTERGWEEVQEVLPDRLAALALRWDHILVSPAWRTQTTIKAYLERHDLRGQIVPELDECSVTSRCPRDSCATPPWQDEPYELIQFEGDEMRLVPRAHRAEWDPDASDNPRPRYDHEAAHLDGERVIMDRAVQLIEEQFEQGAATLLIVTHHDVGRGVLQRLTGSDDDFDLQNAAAYSILKRRPDQMRWRVESLNDAP